MTTVLLLLPLVLGCESPSVAPGPAAETAPEPVVDVVTASVRRGAISQLIAAPGSITARRESRIGAELQARIDKVYVVEGDRVEAGAPLFTVDPETFEVALRQALAGLDVARAERRKAAADLKRARTLEAQQILAADEAERLATSLAVAQAHERSAEASVALARQNLARTTVRAPYAGSIAERLADEGTTALVQPQTIVVVLQETDELEARAAIPESQLAAVHVGDRALVTVEGISNSLRTRITAVSDSIDPATRTYLVKMRVPNLDHRLKAGVFAQVEIHPAARTNTLLIPREAIRTEDGRDRVFVVRDGRAAATPVEVGLVSEQDAEILEGLAVGDQVIVGRAARTIAPEMRVRRVETREAPS
jgi:RND family efflux transporter MFP subunit